MEYQQEILEKLTLRTISYLKDDLGLSYENKSSFEIEEVKQINYHKQVALISLKGDIVGTIGMSISHEFAYDIAKAFVFGDCEDEELQELLHESSKEVLNVTIGNIISDLDIVRNGGKVDISPPFDCDKSVLVKTNEKIMCISKIKYNNQDIILSYIK